MDATVELGKLNEKRGRAGARVDALEREARETATAATAASAALAEFERHGGSATKRRELERALADARARAAEPWTERIAGARQGVRDADIEVQRFVAENLAELVEVLEAEGRIAADELNAAAEAVVVAFQRREAVAARISSLASMVSRVSPGDVTFPRAEALERAAQALLQRGGEEPPLLRRDRGPWSLRFPAEEAVPA